MRTININFERVSHLFMSMETKLEGDPEVYEMAVIDKMPVKDDPREVAITRKLEEVFLKEPWSQKAFADLRELQIGYLKDVLQSSDDPALVYEKTQKVLSDVSDLLRSEIAEGEEFLQSIEKGNPALIMTNHLGTYKLAGIDPQKELGLNFKGYNFMYPSPLFFGGLHPIAKEIGDDLSYVSDDFPGVLGKIHRDSGFIHVPPQGAQQSGRTAYLLDQTAKAFENRKNTALVNFPEGKTTGKYSGKGPYDLEPYKTGGYVIASLLKTRVIPVAQYFDSKKGLRLKVFPTYVPEQNDKAKMEIRANEDQRAMQEWLDECQKSSS